MPRYIRVVAPIAFPFLLVACSGGGDPSGPPSNTPQEPVAVATVAITGGGPMTIGQTRQLSATAYDSRQSALLGRSVAWSSSAPSVASVASDGRVTALAVGAVSIIATIEGKEGTASITVAEAKVVSISLEYPRATMSLQSILSVKATPRDSTGAGIAGKSVKWSSSDPAIIRVQNDGTFLAVAPGLVGLTATIDGVNATIPGQVVAFQSILAGQHETCALTSDGTTFCAGQRYGSRATVVGKWKQILEFGDDPHLTYSHLCGITMTNKVQCWGSNSHGEVGVGDTIDRSTPTQVEINEDVSQISVASTFVCALTVDGHVYCWGLNNRGQLGTGDKRDRSSPVRIASNETFTQVSTGVGHACALTTSGVMYCWGRNWFGELGRGTWSDPEDFPLPAPVKSDLRFKSISVKQGHSCAMDFSNRVYCWGGNTVYEIGRVASQTCSGDKVCETAPTPVSGDNVFENYAASVYGGCGLKSSGDVFCWGMDAQSTLGAQVPLRINDCPGSNGIAGCTSIPVAGPTDFVTLTASHYNYCGIRRDGGAYCWGGNEHRQLGVPGIESTSVPVVMMINPASILP